MAWTTPRTWVTGETVTAAMLNANVRDNLNAIVPLNLATYTTWVPTYDGGTSFDVGNAVVVARYLQVGSIVFVYYSLDFGTSTVFDARFNVSMPVASASPANDYEANRVGHGIAADTSTGNRTPLAVRDQNGSRFRVVVEGGSTELNVSSTSPFTWTVDDRLTFTAMYFA